jgi:hypothetical protein
MPQYSFLDESTGLYEDIFFKFAEAPKIGSYIIHEGRKLRRQATIPYASSDTVNIDPFSQKDFVRATSKAGTLGQLWDESKAMSEKRAQIAGSDPVKDAHMAKQEKETKIVPFEKRRQKAKENLAKKGIILE